MAARPYFTGNYGSALARVDTRPIIEAGRAQGQMYANMGAQIGGMIKEYGLNKQKRAKLTGEIEAYYEQNPEALSQIGMSGDEAKDKKDFTERERFVKGDMNMAQLEGYAGKLARGEVLRSKKLQDESRAIQNQLGEQNLGLREKLEGATVALAEAQTQRAETENRIANMSEEQLLALAKLTTEERRLALQGSIDERKAFTGTDRGEIAKKTAELGIKGQEQSLEKDRLMLDAAKESERVFPAGERAGLERKGMKNDIKYKKLFMQSGFSSAKGASPVSIDLQKNLADAQKELDRMGSLTTTLTDDDDKSLSVIDLLEVKPNREIGLKEGYNLTEMSPVTRNNVQLFLTQSGKVQDAQKQMPVPIQGTVSLTNFGSEPPKVGEIIDFNGQEARVVDITGGVVTVQYEGTLYEKNLQDMEAEQRAEAARASFYLGESDVNAPRFSETQHSTETYGM